MVIFLSALTNQLHAPLTTGGADIGGTNMDSKFKNITSNILLIINTFLTPLVFMNMWNWFITKIGFIHIGYVLAFGIIMTVDFLVIMPSQFNEKYVNGDKDYFFKTRAISFVYILSTALISFILHFAFI